LLPADERRIGMRVRSVVVVAVVLTTAVIAWQTVRWISNDPVRVESIASLKDSCGADVLFIGVRGSGESVQGFGLGDTNYSVERRLSTLLRPIDVVGEPVDYPAVDVLTRVLASGAQGMNVYRQSETAGEEQLVNSLYLWHHRCPDYLFALAGYSQGAHVVGNVMSKLAKDPSSARVFERVVGASLFGDPIYNPADPVAVSPPDRTRVGVLASYLGGVSGPRPVYQPPLTGMIRSWCAAGDPVCSSYPPTAAAQLAACVPKSPCSHLRYTEGATESGARWLADRVRAEVADSAARTPITRAASPGVRTTPPAKTAPDRDCVALVSDGDVPDGTTVTAGHRLVKTWRLRNCGTTNWSGLEAVRTDGDFGPRKFSVPNVRPGSTTDVAITATAPLTAGRFRATYRLQASDGHYADHEFWVEVQVRSARKPADEPGAPPPSSGQIPPADDPGQAQLPAGAEQLGPVNLERYCQAWELHAVKRFSNTWGWRCSASTVPANGNREGDQNVSVDVACQQQYGAGAVEHYADYRDPDSWSCWGVGGSRQALRHK
jgi:Ig-like domain from next to BRCA1 gene/Cutinase